eukprot:203083_1
MASSNIKSFIVLNTDKALSTVSSTHLPFIECITSSKYVVSDADEELLILVEFKSEISLHSFKIYAFPQDNNEKLEDASAPKDVHVYKMKNVNINFDDIKSLKADKSIVCSTKKLTKGQTISLKRNTIKFNKVQYLAIYISSNQKNAETTYINGITFNGNINEFVDKKLLINDNKISNEPQNFQEYIFDATNKQNNIKLIHLSHKLNEVNIDQYKIDSKYLFKASSISTEPNNKCALQNCMNLRRIAHVFDQYNKYHIQQQEDMKQNEHGNIHIDNIYENNYNNHNLLNDYNHLLSHHEHEFDDIHNMLIWNDNKKISCDLSTCVMMRRNQRNRESLIGNSAKLRELYFNDDMVKQQLLDRLHCYYAHTFDMGYRISNTVKEHLLNEELKNVDDIENTLYDPNVTQISQYITNTITNNRTKDFERLNGENNKFTLNPNEYVFGYRFFYWKYYRNSKNMWDDADAIRGRTENRVEPNPGSSVGDWYIDKKYDNFKDEMLNNKICKIDEIQWSNLMDQANCHILTQYAKHHVCTLKTTANCYEFKIGQNIHQNHLLAIMLYCNYTLLQSKFTETFRKLKGETNEELKDRHRNFYFWSRYLRECIECFGMKETLSNTRNDRLGVVEFLLNLVEKTVYHGVNKHFIFAAISALIKGPLSTTTSFAVALNFASNQGLVLEMDMKDFYRWKDANTDSTVSAAACFDCRYVSAFTNESEILFVGGYAQFDFKSILTPLGHNYGKYLKGIKQMCCNMATVADYDILNFPKTSEEKQMVFRLLSHELFKHVPNHPIANEWVGCPDYIKTILSNHVNSIKQIVFRNLSIDNEVIDYLFKYDYGWINIPLITTLFPNTELIEFCGSKMKLSFIQKASIYASLLSFIQKNKQTKLREVYIEINTSFYEKMKSFVQIYEKDFNQYGWMIKTSFFPSVKTTRILIQQISKDMEIALKQKIYQNEIFHTKQ